MIRKHIKWQIKDGADRLNTTNTWFLYETQSVTPRPSNNLLTKVHNKSNVLGKNENYDNTKKIKNRWTKKGCVALGVMRNQSETRNEEDTGSEIKINIKSTWKSVNIVMHRYSCIHYTPELYNANELCAQQRHEQFTTLQLFELFTPCSLRDTRMDNVAAIHWCIL